MLWWGFEPQITPLMLSFFDNVFIIERIGYVFHSMRFGGVE